MCGVVTAVYAKQVGIYKSTLVIDREQRQTFDDCVDSK